MSESDWASKLETEKALDQRKQPWKAVVGHGVADRNARGYAPKGQEADLFDNGKPVTETTTEQPEGEEESVQEPATFAG